MQVETNKGKHLKWLD